MLRGVCVAVATALLAGGCGDEAEHEPIERADTEPISLLPAAWNEVVPGGQTRCGDGSPWMFFVRPGSVNRLVIELQGGGGCWSEETCFITPRAVTSLRREPDLASEQANVGIHDKDDPDNPVADWHHVIVSYCTGDLHWGSADVIYGGRTFFHRGATNVRAVLQWLGEHVWAPEQILVTGHSAGSYGSILWAPWVARQYPSAEMVQLGDGGAGVVPAGVVDGLMALWGVEPSVPSFIDGTTLAKIHCLPDLYRVVASGFPRMRLGQVSAAFDLDQASRMAFLGGGHARDFAAGLQASLAEIAHDVPSFRSYRYPGSAHVVTNRLETQTIDVGGVRFRDWLAAWIAGEPLESVDCGDDCGGPLIGDLQRPEEWGCVLARQWADSAEPADPERKIAVAVHFAPGPLALEDVDVARAFGELDVRACAADDQACARPLDQTRATSVGDARLVVPRGRDGFDGYFLVRGAGAITTRLYVWPPVTSGGGWFMNGHRIAIETPGSLGVLLDRGGLVPEPTGGQVRVSMLDCANSFTARATVELDGRVPDTFVSGALDWITRAPRALFVNVEPGTHALRLLPEAGGAPQAELSIIVEAGTVTDVIGFGPRR
jgi:hypothetical protein